MIKRDESWKLFDGDAKKRRQANENHWRIFMSKNEVTIKENGTLVYSEKDIAERTSQGRRVVVEHVKD